MRMYSANNNTSNLTALQNRIQICLKKAIIRAFSADYVISHWTELIDYLARISAYYRVHTPFARHGIVGTLELRITENYSTTMGSKVFQ